MLYVSNVYSADLPPAGYQLVASHKTEDVELPLRFEFIHPYRKDGVLQERRFKGEVTNFVEKGLNSVLPPLETSTFVQDVRLGKAFLYQATNRSWLSAEDAATVGKRLVAAAVSTAGKVGAILRFDDAADTRDSCSSFPRSIVFFHFEVEEMETETTDEQ